MTHKPLRQRHSSSIWAARLKTASQMFAAGLLASSILGFSPAAATQKPATPVLKPYGNALAKEAKSREACESQPDRIFVEVERGSECIAVFVTKGNERKRHAVLFLDGDIALEKYNNPALMAKITESKHRFMQSWADRSGQRYVDVSRVGVNGSSGNHGERRKPHETLIMNALIDRLRDHLGLDTVTLAGQSGGSTIAASILTFGRKDVTCAVLGSGAFELIDLEHAFRMEKGLKVSRQSLAKVMYDPSEHVDAIAANPRRRIFIIGDTADARTPFDQQVRFAEAIRAQGHHVRVYPVDAQGETDHDAARMTIPIAGACARGDSDGTIQRGIPKKPDAAPKPKGTEVSAAQASPGARLR